ncbi:MAG: hypothetical protein A3A43_03055 [Candidatus Liptonbacteria bacterium RIFCSPLOWO2_01_FULL_56_20]|uniref:Uncharacterized protein n=1 Tax=Candidatus Liptonbacteria bacterium RIFCSPLOWO2_01_FULL_56_20 TaxID=1798652 RepID=A0A1G2CII5_9BACT|nr:MAG: hypothetical protein A2681_00185 [Candidatus Liptonbacteria bacterium RIFCSPHIGHO2_01_FULL_56_18b]OGZ01022.1 MAG: hypothetical protein A3A43_03055 [Candidatus Liptonbacteria bacterium RIFCSPLOWO2_01_FULL_56_20]
MIIRGKSSLPRDMPLVKVVVDIKKNILAMGCDLHIDCADELLADGSERKNLWGANVFPEEKRIDCVSLINIRPADNNRSMEITIPEIRKQVEEVIAALLFRA